MMQAFVVLPAFGFVYLLAGPPKLGKRIVQVVLMGVTTIVAAGWWVAIVELWPVRDRPYIGGSPTNSVLQLALGYNGVGRLTGTTGSSATQGGFAATNIARIGRTDLGGEITWLLPAVVVLTVLAWLLSRNHPDRRRVRASLLLWTTWLAVASTTFLLMAGIFHSYYTVVLAPAIAGLVGIGLWLAWDRRQEPAVRRCLAVAVATTVLLSAGTVAAVGFELRWWTVPIIVAGVAATLVLAVRTGPADLGPRTTAAALSVMLLGPALFSWATIGSAHVGSGPMAGPGHAAASTDVVADNAGPSDLPLLGSSGPVSRQVVDELQTNPGHYRWLAATLGARSASTYELALGQPVLAIGGYKGTDPAPSLAAFIELARTRQVHWFVPGTTAGPTGDAIRQWVESHARPVHIAGYTVYDLSAPVVSVAS
jgi:4-amino-4-deoxy-L-arabinose transferase-like glycosyltransferase